MITAIVKKQPISHLLQDLVADEVVLQECTLSDISMDSRRCSPGALFLALSKNSTDRLKHLEQVIAKGVFVVAYERTQALTEAERTLLQSEAIQAYGIDDLAQYAGEIAARFYDYPSRKMTVIAVTGTNGKTSVTQFIAQGLEASGEPCGVIGTMGAGRLSDMEMTGMTTPDPVTMQRLLASFEIEGCRYVTLEASSHALEQGRLNAIDVDVAVLTNLTRDHLDYHESMAAYAAAKRRLFEMSSVKTVVLNTGDEFGVELSSTLPTSSDIVTYSTQSEADITVDNIECQRHGLRFSLIHKHKQSVVSLPIIGRFNVDNLLATYAVFSVLGKQHHVAVSTLEQCHAVAGRMEAYGITGQALVIIDYAHTPDALEQALKTLRQHLSPAGQLWCVFGCGGDRDKGKRPLMGQIAERDADQVIITDDNPRTENHQSIVDDILAGCHAPEAIYVELDRKLAISYAITHATGHDIILVAGKGHEAYQEIHHVKYPFSDALVVSDTISEMQNGVYNVMGGRG
jgi:UDP-N-acetylmuramoyl-L-alanyl-D-glutamate--2,6-diaminopimelate ligase